jgi:hypothetical protein
MEATDVPTKTTDLAKDQEGYLNIQAEKQQPILTAFQPMIYRAKLLIMKTLYVCTSQSVFFIRKKFTNIIVLY